MAYPAAELISRAFYLSGVVSRQLQTVSGPQLSNGLDLLNSLLSFSSMTTELIPYYELIDLPLVAGQEEYFIPGLFDVESFTYTMGTVRFPSKKLRRYAYFATARPEGINALPATWTWQRTTGGTNFFVYFRPQESWGGQIVGKVGLTNVSDDTDLAEVYDDFYIEYLRYALAQYICQDYLIQFPADKASMLWNMKEALSCVTVPDFKLRSRPLIGQRGRGKNKWAYYNIGQGWVPV